MKKRIISLVLLGISVLTVTACAALQAQSQRMAEKIIRLHVVANSDSDVDQAVKLRVRDAVLREAQNVLSDASDAKQAITAQLPALEAAANAELRRQGSGDTACVSFRRELFPTRDYDTFSLPSGVYQSLRVTIGEGAVQNDGERWLAPEEVLHMDWLCANVRGSIPQYDELLPMARPMVRLLGLYRETLQPEKRGPLL